jgi:hypothetical protein
MQIALIFLVLTVSAVYYLTIVRSMPRPLCFAYLLVAEAATLGVVAGAPTVFWVPGLAAMISHLAWRRREVLNQFSSRQELT